jgi:plasmid stability protein
MRDDSQAFVAQTVRVPEELMARLRVKLAQDGVKFQKKALELLEAYVNSEQAPSEHDRRMRIAKEEMERFRESFEILAN